MKNLSLRFLSFLLSIAMIGMLGCSDDDDPAVPEPEPTLAEVITTLSSDGYSNIAAAVTALNLSFAPGTQYTVLAPNDAAFESLYTSSGVDDLNGLLEALGEDAVRTVVLSHIVEGAAVTSGQLTDGQNITTMSGEVITASISGGNVTFSLGGTEGTVVAANVEASNGIIHGINGVLVPEMSAPESNTFTVTVPGDTPGDARIFLAGDIFAAGAWGQPGTLPELEMTNNGDGTFTLTPELNLADGANSFKIFLVPTGMDASWDYGMVDDTTCDPEEADGFTDGNMQFDALSDNNGNVTYTVKAWQGLGACAE